MGPRVVSLRVPLTTLDRVAAERGLRPDLIKIDVEGAEMDVLRGAERLLGDARPTVIVESWARSPDRAELFAFFAARGYVLHEAAGDAASPALTQARFFAAAASNFGARPTGPRAAPSVGARAAVEV